GLPRALLPQPGGFERGAAFDCAVHADDSAASERPDDRERLLGRRTAVCPLARLATGHEHRLVAQLDELFPLDPIVAPLAEELLEEACYLSPAVAEDPARWQLGPEGGLWCEQSSEAPELAPRPVVVEAAQGLDVLLRHRPRSISPDRRRTGRTR